ncbi:hypothetical protein KY290_002535 [Solanum tuberosum]|uniref:Uncharacterized protein n=1 Tax=Solanum tuberosum TaxID=4113 RepID=A0ABQ7WQC1_SOLTU|nr:hypothetical protein KY285_002464 [Solanum tuberosum]KAH0782937.1 hypothetical protein KY290_002535 [Solanum tuberosum]
MGVENKTLFCYCRWGWTEKVLPDGTTLYVGGITRQVTVKTRIKYNDFVNTVFDRLGIVDPSDKILQFTAKFCKSTLIDLRDQKDVNAMLQFNDGYADVYVSSLVKEPYSRPASGNGKNVELPVVSESKPNTTHVRDDENDLATPLKKVRCIQSAGDSLERLNQNGADLPEGDVQNNSSKIGIFNKQASKPPSDDGNVIVISDSEPDTTPDNTHLVNKQASIPPSFGTYNVNPKELYKFPHRIPSFKMTGNERKGVPTGSFELNPYALPLNPNDIWYPGKVKETGNSRPVENVLSAVPSGSRDKSRTSEHASTSLMTGYLNGVHAANGEFPMSTDLELKLWFGETQK